MTTRFRLLDGVNSFTELYVWTRAFFLTITIFHFAPTVNRKIKQIDLFEVGWKTLDATGRFPHISNKKTTTPIRSLNMCYSPANSCRVSAALSDGKVFSNDNPSETLRELLE